MQVQAYVPSFPVERRKWDGSTNGGDPVAGACKRMVLAMIKQALKDVRRGRADVALDDVADAVIFLAVVDEFVLDLDMSVVFDRLGIDVHRALAIVAAQEVTGCDNGSGKGREKV